MRTPKSVSIILLKLTTVCLIQSMFLTCVIADTTTTDSKNIAVSGRIDYDSKARYIGVARSGFSFDTSGAPRYEYNETTANLLTMLQDLPNINLIQIPICMTSLFPNCLTGDFMTVNVAYQNVLDNFIAVADIHKIKVILGCHSWYTDQYPSDLFTNSTEIGYFKMFFRYLAQRYPDIVGFDIINEPYNSIAGWNYPTSPTISEYTSWIESVIDDFRTVNPSLTAFVQPPEPASYIPMDWVRTTPIQRTNVTYCPHPYAVDWDTGDWRYFDYAQSYKNGDYVLAKTQLEAWSNRTWGFIKQDLHYDVYVGEFCAPETEAGLHYLTDFLELMQNWNISYSYWCWTAGVDRPCALTQYPSNTNTKAMVNILRNDS